MRRFSWSRISSDVSTAFSVPSITTMPDARGPPFVGAVASIINSGFGSNLHEYIDSLHRRHGLVFRGRIGPVESVFVNSPQEMRKVFHLEGPTPRHFLPEAWLHYNQMRNCKRGLLFMDGEEWLNCRRKLNRIMLAGDSANHMIKPCHRVAESLANKWQKYAKEGKVVADLENQLYQYLMEVVIANFMGTTKNERQGYPTVTKELAQSLCGIFENSLRLAALPTKLAKTLHLPWWKNFVRSADDALNGVSSVIDEILKNPVGDGMLAKMREEGIPDDELKRIVVDFIIAAGDATSFSMQWLFYLLSKHQDVQEELYENLRSASPQEILDDFLLKAVIKESLRLYPTAPFIARILPQDALLGGYPVHKNELIVLSLYSSGRDEANFPQAQKFIPERWRRNEKGQFSMVKDARALLPFAMGARSCIGKKLAEIQMSFTIIELIKKFKIDLLNKSTVKIKLRMITAPSEPLKLILRPRE